MNMPWDSRGRRCDEHIEMMRAIWSAPEGLMEWHGPYFDLPPMDPRPQPARESIPILIGGHSDPALDRAARLGDGWIAASMSPERFIEHRDKLFRMAEGYGRDPSELMLVTGTSTSVKGGELSAAAIDELVSMVRGYEDLGVHHLKIGVQGADQASTMAGLEAFGLQVIPELSD
jgi:alkanesulfonate monooxygenase SsuD/methylene tetrahydromethanopterin reductase-like flavin-dependent oxidoreductase (luciferase family)